VWSNRGEHTGRCRGGGTGREKCTVKEVKGRLKGLAIPIPEESLLEEYSILLPDNPALINNGERIGMWKRLNKKTLKRAFGLELSAEPARKEAGYNSGSVGRRGGASQEGWTTSVNRDPKEVCNRPTHPEVEQPAGDKKNGTFSGQKQSKRVTRPSQRSQSTAQSTPKNPADASKPRP